MKKSEIFFKKLYQQGILRGIFASIRPPKADFFAIFRLLDAFNPGLQCTRTMTF